MYVQKQCIKNVPIKFFTVSNLIVCYFTAALNYLKSRHVCPNIIHNDILMKLLIFLKK